MLSPLAKPKSSENLRNADPATMQATAFGGIV